MMRVLSYFVAVLSFALVGPIPATSQDQETCIAFLEADSEFDRSFRNAYRSTVSRLSDPIVEARKRLLYSEKKLLQARSNVILVLSKIYVRANEQYRTLIETAIEGDQGVLRKYGGLSNVAIREDIIRVLNRKDSKDFKIANEKNYKAGEIFQKDMDNYNHALSNYWEDASKAVTLADNSAAENLANEAYSRKLLSKCRGPKSNNQEVMKDIIRVQSQRCRELFE